MLIACQNNNNNKDECCELHCAVTGILLTFGKFLEFSF